MQNSNSFCKNIPHFKIILDLYYGCRWHCQHRWLPRPIRKKFCWGLVPRVPQVTGYDPKHLDTTWIPLAAKWLGSLSLCARYGPTTPGWSEGTTNLKRTRPGLICNRPLSHLSSHGRAGFHQLSARYSSSLTQLGTHPGPPQSHPGVFSVPGKATGARFSRGSAI
jgi:hypothetical protein